MVPFLVLAVATAQEPVKTAQSIISQEFGISTAELERAAIVGMMEHIEKQTSLSGSSVLTAEMFLEEKAWKEGLREGYGVRVQLIPRQGFLVDEVIPNSPAEQVGILSRDLITSFAGQSLLGLPPQSMLNILNQDYSQQISVGLLRDGEQKNISIQKDTFQMEMFSLGHEGYIPLHFFGKGVCKQLEEVIRERADQPLIFDLRDNEGGLWEESIACLDLFLEKDTILGYRQMVDGMSIPVLSQKEAQHFAPMVIVINQGTKGPAELFALVLQEYGRAELVGETTYGVSVDFQYYKINPDIILKIADTELISAKKISWRNKGVSPDVSMGLRVDRPSYTGAVQTDLQLETALQLISSD